MKRSQIINEAFSITIRNRSLWIVALIALGLNALVGLILPAQGIVSAIIKTLVNFAVTAFLAGALIRMVDSIAERQTVSVSEGFEAGTRSFIQLLIVRVALMIPVWIVLIFATGSFLSIFSELGRPGGIRAYNIANLAASILGTLGMLMLLSVITSAIGVGAERAVVLENLSVIHALKRGAVLLINRLVDFIFIGLMLFVVVLAIAILVGCLSSVIALPLIQSDFEYGEAIDVPITPSAVPTGTITSIIVGAILSLVVGALTSVLFSGAWTLAFRQWQGKPPILPET
ncbi:MAG: hypothetical protein GTO14_03150 [Anaerolineales bacterium]|nr:hypothetical protein [Anaerolineales bacterium]